MANPKHKKSESEGLLTGHEAKASETLERRMEEQTTALRESEDRYRTLFENMIDGFAHCQMVFDDERPVDYIYLDVNSEFGRLTGVENVVGKRVTEIIPKIREVHAELLETYGRVVRTGNPERFEIDFKPLEKWLSVAVYSTQRDPAAIFEDITERKQMEDALKFLVQCGSGFGRGFLPVAGAIPGPEPRHGLCLHRPAGREAC